MIRHAGLDPASMNTDDESLDCFGSWTPDQAPGDELITKEGK